MGAAQRYRRSVSECLALAGKASDPADRAFLISMAAETNELVDAPASAPPLQVMDQGTTNPPVELSNYRKRR